MAKLLILEEWVNKTEGHRLGDSGVFESRFETPGEAYKYYLKEYGRCVGKCYVGEGKQVGWVFQKCVKYTDQNGSYLQETWVSLHTAKPVETRTYKYADL